VASRRAVFFFVRGFPPQGGSSAALASILRQLSRARSTLQRGYYKAFCLLLSDNLI